MLCSYGNQVETSLSSCGYKTLPLEVEEKEELKILLKCGKFSFYLMVDSEVFTYLKNKKFIILVVNKKFLVFHF